MAPGTFIYDIPEKNHTLKMETLKEHMRNETAVRRAPALYGDDMGELMADMLEYDPETRLSMNQVFKRL